MKVEDLGLSDCLDAFGFRATSLFDLGQVDLTVKPEGLLFADFLSQRIARRVGRLQANWLFNRLSKRTEILASCYSLGLFRS